MSTSASAGELAAGYEALRAEARGARGPTTPRGLAVLQSSGLPGWMRAFPPTERPQRRSRSPLGAAGDGTRAGAELVCLLAEMALASRGRCLA